VLPLLSEAFATSGWVGNDAFLAGYGAAQAVPGPLFTFAAYLGAVVRAALDLIGIFLPGINPYGHAAVLGHVPQTCRRAGSDAGGQCGNGRTPGRRTLQPGLDQLSQGAGRPAIALCGFALLTIWRAPPLAVVIFSALAGTALALAAS
jgi:chromate transporter